jgi:hypothetical protein
MSERVIEACLTKKRREIRIITEMRKAYYVKERGHGFFSTDRMIVYCKYGSPIREHHTLCLLAMLVCRSLLFLKKKKIGTSDCRVDYIRVVLLKNYVTTR